MKSTSATTRFVAPNATARRNSTGVQSGAGRGGYPHTTTSNASRAPLPASATTMAPAGSASPGLESLAALHVPVSATIPLIDPTGFGGLIQVPVTKTMDTKGRMEFFQGILRKEVSLCCLFQKGRCHAAEKCHQIHVDATFIKNVRAQNAHVISCCRACKDTASLSANAVTFFATHCDQPTVKIVAPDARFSVVDSTKIAITIGLTQHVESLRAGASLTSIPAKKMCRLHLRGACKYGKDCKNVHLCSKLGEAILIPTHSPVPEETRSSSTSTGSAPASARTSRTPTPTPAPVAGIMDRNATPRVVVGAALAAPSKDRRNSTTSTASTVSSDAPKDYFTESRFQTPPAASLSASASVETDTMEGTMRGAMAHPSDLDEDQLTKPLTFSQVDLTNVSFMATSVAMPNLCFDPAMALWEDDVPKHQPKNLSAEWFDDCGVSTTSQSQTPQSHTPTPSKMLW